MSDAQDFLWETVRLRVWTHRQINCLNYMLGRKEMADVIRMDPKEPVYINLPVSYFEQPDRQARIHWIEDLGEGFFMSGLEFQNGEMTQWILELTDQGFRPMFNALTIDMNELRNKAARMREIQQLKARLEEISE